MNLELSRPIAFIDVQSTGLDPATARIVALAVVKIMPDGERHSRSVTVDPGVPIPPGATAVHGITDDDVAGLPPFKAYASALADHLADCDIAGFGVERFGAPLLETELQRAEVEFSLRDRAVIDAMAIFHKKEPRDLAAAHEVFVGGPAPARENGDEIAIAALEILEGELEAYEDIPRDVPGIQGFLKPRPENAVDQEGMFVWSGESDAVFNFGRYKGEGLLKVAEEAPDYLAWMANRPDFPDDVKQIAADAMRGDFPQPEIPDERGD
jgi:DNA polymerase-3 subunit epsilon